MANVEQLPFLHFAVFLVIFVEATSLPVPQQILGSVTFCRYRWG